MQITKLPLSHFVNLLETRQPFSFSRWGDGEWLTTLGYIGLHNSNGCTFTQELCNDYRQVLDNQHDYYHGILGIARRKKGEEIEKFLKSQHCDIVWYNGDVFLKAALKGKLFPLVEQVREYRVLYIGNERLRYLNMRGKGFFSYQAYIQPPPLNAHLKKERILNQVRALVNKHKIELIGWSSGLATKVFIDEIFKWSSGEITQIDFGSLFDGYFSPLSHIADRLHHNTGSRSYIRKGGHDWDDLLKLNTGQQ